METVFSTILFILPGIISMLAMNEFGKGSTKKLSDYEITLYGIFLSVLVLLGAWGLYNVLHHHTTLKIFISLIQPNYNAIIYLLVAVVIALVYGLLLGKWINRLTEILINRIRGKEVTHHSQSVWETFTHNREGAVVRVYPIGNKETSYLGILSRWSTSNDTESGILLIDTELCNELDEYLHSPQRSYFDKTSGFIYEYFNEEQVNAAVNKKISDKVAASSEN